jgi:hypothetical protein
MKSIKKKKQIAYKGKPIKFTADFSTETLKVRRERSEVFQTLNGAIKTFQDKQKLKQYMTSKSPLQKILQGILHTENEKKHNHKRTGSAKPQEEKRQGIRE